MLKKIIALLSISSIQFAGPILSVCGSAKDVATNKVEKKSVDYSSSLGDNQKNQDVHESCLKKYLVIPYTCAICSQYDNIQDLLHHEAYIERLLEKPKSSSSVLYIDLEADTLDIVNSFDSLINIFRLPMNAERQNLLLTKLIEFARFKKNSDSYGRAEMRLKKLCGKKSYSEIYLYNKNLYDEEFAECLMNLAIHKKDFDVQDFTFKFSRFLPKDSSQKEKKLLEKILLDMKRDQKNEEGDEEAKIWTNCLNRWFWKQRRLQGWNV